MSPSTPPKPDLTWILNLLAFLVLLLSVISPLVLDLPITPYAVVVGITFVLATIVWRWTSKSLRRKLSLHIKRRSFRLFIVVTIGRLQPLIRFSVIPLIAVAAIGLGYRLWVSSKPQFDITAFNTLIADKNAYEITDQLIVNRDKLLQNNIGITFTLQVRPSYYGVQNFGRLVAIISSADSKKSLVKPLWDNFKASSETMNIQLTLPELLEVSGLQPSLNPPSNTFRPGGFSPYETKINVQIVPEGERTKPLDSGHELVIRNSPWQLQANLVERNNRYEVDAYVQNLGGDGQFKLLYSLVRLDQEVSSSNQPMLSGATPINFWKETPELKQLKQGDYITATQPLTNTLEPGRYLVEVGAIKQQNFVHFLNSSTSWSNIYTSGLWKWFSGPLQRFIFVVPNADYKVDAAMKAEVERVRNEQNFDLGTAIKDAEDVTSARGTSGRRQVFKNGEIYIHDGAAYSIYGATLTHYTELGGYKNPHLGFPTSQLEKVTSSSGEEGTRMEFEESEPNPQSVIYDSKRGVAAVWGWIGHVYHNENGGHEGWLGFPLAGEQYYSESTAQMFEYGYVIYLTPKVNGETDYGRPPITYPYLASRGTLFDVSARDVWQQTDITIHPGDRVTILQVGGSWTNNNREDYVFDANGSKRQVLQKDANLPSVLIGSLIGRIGDGNASPFLLGRWQDFKAADEGTLYLKMNDNAYEDNAGYITIQIIVEPSEK